VQNMVSLLSTCVYPDAKFVNYPLTEEQLHMGPPHNSNFAYAFAKRMVEVQSRAYRVQHNRNYTTAIPNNIFGPHDNFDLEDGHVVPAVIRKIYEARQNKTNVSFWGDGTALREFTFSDDIAACLLKMVGFQEKSYVYDSPLPANIGINVETSIKDLVETVADIWNFQGQILWDTDKPSGQYRKPSLAKKIRHDYMDLKRALTLTCKWFEENYPHVRGIPGV